MKLFGALSVVVIASMALSLPASAQTADMVFTNANVLTMDDANPTAEAVAVTGNKITYVGDAAEAQALIGDGTEVFDLGGDTLLPGFVSGHDHLIASSWTSRGVNLFGVTSLREAVAIIKQYADANPDEELILGYGFNRVEYGRWPTKQDLDAVLPDRPVFILDNTIHDIWMNTAAFEAGGVAPDDPDMVPGVMYWQRDDAGELTGVGIELQWAPAFQAAGAWNPKEEIPVIQQQIYAEAVKHGMTAVHVPAIAAPGITNQELAKGEMEIAMAHLGALEKEGKLTLRTFVANAFKDPNGNVTEVVDHTLHLRNRYDSDMLRAWGIKIHPEGNWSSKTSAMIEPYSDGSGDRGAPAVSPSKIMHMHLEANSKGLPVGTHVDGSQTVRDTIDAILASREAGYDIPNNILHHYFWVAEPDHRRVIENDIMVNVTPQFSTDWEGQAVNAYEMLGRARAETQYARYSQLMSLGHNVSISADVPSSPISMIAPLFSVEIAMTLQDPTSEASIPFPLTQQPATLEEALKAITIYPAAQQAMEDKIGSIEVGKLADLVVLDRDITQVAPRDISAIQVLGTVLDGKFTHRDGL